MYLPCIIWKCWFLENCGEISFIFPAVAVTAILNYLSHADINLTLKLRRDGDSGDTKYFYLTSWISLICCDNQQRPRCTRDRWWHSQVSFFRVWTKLNNVASNFVNIRAEIEDASVTVTLVSQTPFQMEQSSFYQTLGDEKHLKKLCQYDEQ